MTGSINGKAFKMVLPRGTSLVTFHFLFRTLVGIAVCLSLPTLHCGQKVTPANPVTTATSRVVTAKGSRSLSIYPSMPQDNDYEQAFTIVQRLGVQEVGLTLDWRDIEVHPKIYRNPYLKIANDYYPPKKAAVDLTIRPVSTNVKSVPDDLAQLPFSDARLISRFEALMDFVLSQTSQLTLSSIVIGSECDLYLKRDGTQWKQYTVFCKAIAKYLRTRKPGVKIAFEATYPGLVGSCKEELKALNQFSDLVGVSYYPIGPDFTVKDPAIVRENFQTITTIYPNQQLYFYQLGYPSSTILNSSEEKQAQFVKEVFAAWDLYAGQIGKINFISLTDSSDQEVASQSQYYGLNHPRFNEFIRTLGLRRYPRSGEDKPALLTLQQEARARGW